MSVASPLNWHAEHTATLLTTGPRTGQVLIAGGTGSYPDLATTNEFFDPTTGTYSAAPGLSVPRLQHTATALPDGRIAFVGGSTNWNSWTPTSAVEVYDPVADTFTATFDLLVERTQQSVDVIGAGVNAGKLCLRQKFQRSCCPELALGIVALSLPDQQDDSAARMARSGWG